MLNRKFGVEIEANIANDYCLDNDIAPQDVIYILLRNNFKKNSKIKFDHYSDDCHYDADPDNFTGAWSIKSDGSLDYRTGFEMSSPILKGKKGLTEVDTIVKTLNQFGCSINSRCGLHVHVDAKDLSEDEKLAVVARYNNLHDKIKKFVKRDRWTRSARLGEYSINRLVHDLIETQVVVDEDYDGRTGGALSISGKYPTLEFRQHEGSLNSKEIQNWIKFCVNFVEQSVKLYREERAKQKLQRLRKHKVYPKIENNCDKYAEMYSKVIVKKYRNDSPVVGLTPAEKAYFTRLSATKARQSRRAA